MKFLLSLLTLIAATASAQPLTFKTGTKDRGQTSWYQPISATFRFTNTSDSTLYIQEVDAGCGCMNTSWTDEVIDPGQEGKVVVTYNAELLGRFDRLIAVRTNIDPQPQMLRMKCKVVSKQVEQQPDEDELEPVAEPEEFTPDFSRPLMAFLPSATVTLKYRPAKKIKGFVTMTNLGDGYLIVDEIKSLTDAITVDNTKLALKKKQKFKIRFVLDTSKLDTPEQLSEFVIISNDQAGNEHSVKVVCQ